MRARSLENLTGWAFLAPHAVLFGVFTLFPMLFAGVVSLHKWNLLLPLKWVGLGNYATALADSSFWHALKVTLYYVAGTVPATIFLAIVLAVLLNRPFVGRTWCRVMIYLPVVTSMVSVGIIWNLLFNASEQSMANRLLLGLGLPHQRWLADPALALPCVILVSIWKDLGFNTIIALAGLQAIPGVFYEAAVMDGASRVRQFWGITIPLLSPTTFFLFILNTIGAFKVFTTVYVLTRGGPFDGLSAQNATEAITYSIYRHAFGYLRMGYASSLAYILFAIILLVTILNFRFGERRVHYQ